MTDVRPKPGLIPWPPLIYAVAIALSVVLGIVYPLPWIGDLLGDLLFAAGWVALFGVAALWFTAIRAMMRARTTMNPNAEPVHLVISGPFGVTRNPMYLANTLLLIGVAFVTGIVWFLSTDDNATPIHELSGKQVDHLTLLIGPEGGWSDEELARFAAANLTGVKLTATILRIETAAIAIAASLSLRASPS